MAQGKSPTQYLGVLAKNPPNLTIAQRAPNSGDTAFPLGELWLDDSADTSWMNAGSGVWVAMGSGATGGVVTITASSGGALSPVGGTIILAGTANQITTAGAGHTVTFTIPATFIAPGSIASTSTITAGTGLTVTSGNLVATNGNLVLVAPGNKINRSSVATTTAAGANAAGTVTLVGGTATVSTTSVTTNSLIRLSRMSVGATGAAALGELSVGTIVNGTSFVINAWQQANATALQASDVSSIYWEITN